MCNLLQLEELKSFASMHVPFHLDGIGPMSLSLKLSDSGHIPVFFFILYQTHNYIYDVVMDAMSKKALPVSRIPIMLSYDPASGEEGGLESIFTAVWYLRKSHE